MKSLDDLPSLAEIKDLDKGYPELALIDHHAEVAEEAGSESETTADELAEVDDNEEVEAEAVEETLADDSVVDEMESEEDAFEESESEDIDDTDEEATSASGI